MFLKKKHRTSSLSSLSPCTFLMLIFLQNISPIHFRLYGLQSRPTPHIYYNSHSMAENTFQKPFQVMSTTPSQYLIRSRLCFYVRKFSYIFSSRNSCTLPYVRSRKVNRCEFNINKQSQPMITTHWSSDVTPVHIDSGQAQNSKERTITQLSLYLILGIFWCSLCQTFQSPT